MSVAAYDLAKSNRSCWMSTAMTLRAPRALATAMHSRPTGPAPKTIQTWEGESEGLRK